ncbi:hypothetical protein B0H13DRAFT_592106 [Mycena leptocephala]|nr:hypothetical protein B0H13DRAFT_592106 [Mycena leptocephala]
MIALSCYVLSCLIFCHTCISKITCTVEFLFLPQHPSIPSLSVHLSIHPGTHSSRLHYVRPPPTAPALVRTSTPRARAPRSYPRLTVQESRIQDQESVIKLTIDHRPSAASICCGEANSVSHPAQISTY